MKKTLTSLSIDADTARTITSLSNVEDLVSLMATGKATASEVVSAYIQT